MHEVLRDPAAMSAVIRRRVLRAMAPAVRMIDRVARGDGRFADDQQRLACVVLARLAPLALTCAAAGDEQAEQEEAWAATWTPRRFELFEKLQRLSAPATPEAGAEAWAEQFLQGEGMPVGVDTLEKARQYGAAQFEEAKVHLARVRQSLARAKYENGQRRRR